MFVVDSSVKTLLLPMLTVPVLNNSEKHYLSEQIILDFFKENE